MTRRSGMSLTEVLVALFILTIGVIGILTMFPLAAAQMARAVRDDRSALAASNADGYMRWYWANYVVNPTLNPGLFGTQDTFLINGTGLFDNPYQTFALGATGLQSQNLPAVQMLQNIGNQTGLNSLVGQVSYPVIVDPYGFQARGWNFGDAPNYAQIPRYNLQYGLNGNAVQQPLGNIVAQPQGASFNLRSCSLTDSLGYNDNGTPTNDLEMRYNWFWILQRPQMNQDPSQISPNAMQPNNPLNPNPVNLYNNANTLSFMNMTVVVFDRRPFGYPPKTFQGFETVMGATFTTGLTSVVISPANSQQALDLKPGSWVMDATITPANPPGLPFPIRQANFYRVVSVVSLNGQVNLELQTPISPPTGYPPLGYSYPGTLVALNGVSGVFVRPPLTPYP
jgi:hypothetical protein